MDAIFFYKDASRIFEKIAIAEVRYSSEACPEPFNMSRIFQEAH